MQLQVDVAEFNASIEKAKKALDYVAQIAQLTKEKAELQRKYDRLSRSNAGLSAELDNVRVKSENYRRHAAQAIAILAHIEEYLETNDKYDKLTLMKLILKPIE